MKFFLLFLLLFFSQLANAEWKSFYSGTSTSTDSCTEHSYPGSLILRHSQLDSDTPFYTDPVDFVFRSMTSCSSGYRFHMATTVHYYDSVDPLSPESCPTTFDHEINNYYNNMSSCIPPDTSDYDSLCEAIKPDYVTLPVDPGLGFFWDSAGCTFYTSDVVPCLETPSGQYSCIVTDAYAHDIEPPADDPISDDIDRDSSSEYTATSDPANDCPFSNVSWGGQSYCYNGPDASQGAEYADGSSRVNHYDGSYTVYDNQGQGVTYNPDGSPSGTASTSPGAVGPGTDNSGCPPWAPKWLCDRDSESLAVTVGDGDGTTAGELAGMLDGAEGGGEMPIEFIDPMQNQSDWSTGLATTGVCPVPSDINISFGPVNHSFQISYLPFCQFAEYLRYIIIAMAYLAASMIAYRGLV